MRRERVKADALAKREAEWRVREAELKRQVQSHPMLYIGSISASPTAYLLHGYGCAGTQNDRLAEAVVLSTGTSIPAQ